MRHRLNGSHDPSIYELEVPTDWGGTIVSAAHPLAMLGAIVLRSVLPAASRWSARLRADRQTF